MNNLFKEKEELRSFSMIETEGESGLPKIFKKIIGNVISTLVLEVFDKDQSVN